jgi:hypothetical protein
MILQLEYTRYDETTSGKEKIVDLTDGLANHTHSVNIEDIPGLSAQLAGMTGGLLYKGTWDPSTGLLPLEGDGWYYVVNGSGTVDGTEYNTKDMILWNGSSWDKIDNTDSVVSVNGQTGVVTLTIPSGDYNDLTNQPDLSGLHSHSNNIDLYPDPTGATTGYVLKKTGVGLAFQPSTDNFTGSYNDLTNKPDLTALHNHSNNIDQYPDPTGVQEGQILIGKSGGGGLEYQSGGYTKGQVDTALSYKLDASQYNGTIIQTKLGTANLHVLTPDEYASIGSIPNMVAGSGTNGLIPKFVAGQKIGNGFSPVEVINDTVPGNTVIPLEVAVVDFVNNRIASNATGTYRKANVLAIADYESAPPTTNEGDRYILAKDDGSFTGSVDAGWGSVSPGDLVYYDSSWKQESGTSPAEGWTVFIEEIDKYAVFCVGTPTKWAIGSIGRPVVDGSQDTDRSKLVSDKIIDDLTTHMNSTHADKIDALVDKAYIESRLTGPITTHSHPASQAPQTELENVDVNTPGVISYPVGAYSLKRNYTLKDSNEKEASVVGVIPQGEPSYSHPYSTGDRRSSLNLQVTSGGLKRAELVLLSGEKTIATSYNVEYVVTFPEMLSIGGVRFITNAETVEIEINGNIVHSFYGEPYIPKHSGADFEAIISDAITVRASCSAPHLPEIYANEYKLADLGTDIDVAYSGELLTATPVYYLEALPKYKEYHFDSWAAGTSVIQTQKGYESLWVEAAAKIVKMDCYSISTTKINCMVNGVPVFQNPVQTGSDWAYSGLVNDGANVLNPGEGFEVSSDASGTNLLVRVWYLAV